MENITDKEIKTTKINKIYIYMVFTALFWSGAFIAGKYSSPYIPPFTLTFMRFFYAAIILFAVMRFSKPDFKLEKKHVPVFAFTGIVGMFGYHVLFFACLKYTTAMNASIIGAANPMVTTLLACLFMKQPLSKRQTAGILLSFCGVVLTITSANPEFFATLTLNRGDLLMTVAMVIWAVYTVFSKVKGEGIPPIIMTYYSFIVCTVFLIPFVLYEKPWIFWEAIPWQAHGAVLYMSIFPSVIGYLVQQMSIKEIGPSRTNIFVNLVPVFSIVLSIIILGEEFVLVKLATAAIIIAGVYICQKPVEAAVKCKTQ